MGRTTSGNRRREQHAYAQVDAHAGANGTERRRAPLQIRQPVLSRIAILSGESRAAYCLIRNISANGAAVKLYGRVVVGAAAKLQVGDEEPIPGRIVWARREMAGIAFSNPLESDALLRVMQKKPTTRRRSSPRVSTVAQIVLKTGGGKYVSELRDISAIGAKIRTRRPVNPGRSAMLIVPGMPMMRAFVRWVDDTELGLAFDVPLPIQVIAQWLDERVTVSG
ncbi:MAG TPA: PilZ domain-containing protein [Sphingomicrobium sp.]|nr:PilZ domain-containing protein [Sphingomicrobium sp.]